MSAALPMRVLRLLNSQANGLDFRGVERAFAGRHPRYLASAIDLLAGHHLITRSATHVWQLTDAGRAVLALRTPPRWSAPRRSVPRRAPIAL